MQCFFCWIPYYMNNIHLQPAFHKKLSLIPLTSYCNSNVNGHLVIFEEIAFRSQNKLNPYWEIGNLALFLNPLAYMMWLEKISVDFASSSLEVLILYIRFSSELNTIQSNRSVDMVLSTENFQTCWLFSTWHVYYKHNRLWMSPMYLALRDICVKYNKLRSKYSTVGFCGHFYMICWWQHEAILHIFLFFS